MRLAMAAVLVFVTYNPTKYSWVDWLLRSEDRFDPLILLCGIVLLIGWVIFLRATARSLGLFGILLSLALVGTLVWLLVDYGILSLDSSTVVQYIVLIVISIILAVGISWSHIRRRMTGQLDVDDVDED
jgi:hypothetical protein